MPQTRRNRSNAKELSSIWLMCLCIAIVILTALETNSNFTKSSAQSQHPITIVAGSSTQRDLTAGATEVFAIKVDEGKLLRFSIDKGDLGLWTRIYGPSGTKLFEHLSRDFEVVRVALAVQAAGVYRIELKSLETVKRQYELKVQSLIPLTAAGRMESDARKAMAHAEVLRGMWKEAFLRQAIEEYETASLIWKSAGDFNNASRANLKSGELYFLLSRYREALKRYQEAHALARKTGDWLAEACALSQMARLYSYQGKNDLAQKHLTKALDLFKRGKSNFTTEARIAYGEALSNLGEIVYSKGNLKKALIHFEEARESFEGHRNGLAKVHLFAGYIAGSIGNPDKAVAEISRALDLYRRTNNKSGEGRVLATLGLWRSLKPGQGDATALHKGALEIFRSIGDRHSEAIVLNAVGQVYENMNEYFVALNNYEQALELFQDIGAVDGAAASTCNIARTYHLNHDSKQAFAFYYRCLRLSRSAGKVRTEAYAMSELANVYVAQNNHKRAAKQYRRTQSFYEAIGDLRGKAKVLNAHGDFLMQLNQNHRALGAYRQALPLSEKAGDPVLLLNTLYNLARVNAALESPEVALPFIERSLKTIEDLRANVASPELRISYFSGVGQHYELCIDILAQLEGRHPGKGYGARAFLTSEKSRARLLLDLVNESRASLHEGASNELHTRESELRGLIRTEAQNRLDLAPNKRNSAELGDAENHLVQLKTEYQVVEGQLRQQNRHLSSLEQSSSLSLEEIQDQLRGTDTLLLEYSLGSERSYLWAVTYNTFRIYELPPRKIVEDAATEFYQFLTARQGVEGQSAKDYRDAVEAADNRLTESGSKLSQILLGPVAEQLGSRRLVVVPEGALQCIPFDALTVPTSSPITPSKTLLEATEVVVLPSFSTLIALRRDQKNSNSPSKLVAIIADPVFTSSDDRVSNEAVMSSQAATYKNPELFSSTVQTLTRNRLPRLTHAAEEADTIAAVAPWSTTMVAKGFDATREIATSSEVTQHQIVHFATHGYLDSKHPELSGIVLSMIDRNGARINGLMPLYDIYNLDLRAELTVLSACQTAIGKDISGEGLVGLTHAFMSAGSRSVVASLWKVDDRATAALMADFYDSMLRKGMSPSAALRLAKLKMLQHKRWSAPYYWAGFVLQGEYTNRIVVYEHSSLRVFLLLIFFVPVISAGLFVFKNEVSATFSRCLFTTSR